MKTRKITVIFGLNGSGKTLKAWELSKNSYVVMNTNKVLLGGTRHIEDTPTIIIEDCNTRNILNLKSILAERYLVLPVKNQVDLRVDLTNKDLILTFIHDPRRYLKNTHDRRFKDAVFIDMNKHKNCPFCGGVVDINGWINGEGKRGPGCEKCGSTAPTMKVWDSRAE